jgi:putative hydrolase of the HAD superfamily
MRYLEASYILPDVRGTLEWLAGERGLSLGVISNFMVPGGIGQILQKHHLADFFKQVWVSCNIGWKKPSEVIFSKAIQSSQASPGEIVFVGDSLLADYDGSRMQGMKSVLFDPQDASPKVQPRIRNLFELKELV